MENKGEKAKAILTKRKTTERRCKEPKEAKKEEGHQEDLLYCVSQEVRLDLRKEIIKGEGKERRVVRGRIKRGITSQSRSISCLRTD